MSKQYVSYPIAQTLEQAKTWLEGGNELWQEITEEYPECAGIDDVSYLYEILDIDVNSDDFDSEMDISDYLIHLVKKGN